MSNRRETKPVVTLRLDEFLPYRLSIATNVVSKVISTAYEALFGLAIPEWRLIAVLAEMPNVTQLDIGTRTGMDKVTVSRAAATLFARGLIARTSNPADKRSHLLGLTEIGERLYAEVVPTALGLESRLLEGFSEAEIEHFLAMLRRLEIAAERVA